MALSPEFVTYLEAVRSSEEEFMTLSLAERTAVYNNFNARGIVN
jgi:hypothetical protein